jgi:hypothetical protein
MTVNVLDVNDNAPIFKSSNYSFFTVESYNVGRQIGIVSAEDGDRGLFGEILYTLEAMDQADGMCYVKFFLEYSSNRKIQPTVN